ncbi:MAG: hypothetical protein EBT63_01775 [Proteobacteria bacterium]|nr:hypothetical protein [Pseudomonadota bacterium]NCA28566.1 hypothetical protein [Pseudomonadota bacterium]
MENFLTNYLGKFDFKNKIHCLAGFAFMILCAQLLIYFMADGKPVFSTNDSYGYYLTEAKNIYRQSSIHDIAKLGLDLYFDQVEFANYDPRNFKPIHFPIYSPFLSLFFSLFDNEFLVIASSQFLLCLTMLYFCHLILINYLEPEKSFIILVLFLWFSPLLIFLCDSNAEIFTGAFIMISFYLTLFAKKRTGVFYYLCLFLSSTIMFLRIKYLVLIPVLSVIFRLFCKFSKNEFQKEEQEIDIKNTIFFIIFAIVLPFIIHLYAYNNLGWHYLNMIIIGLEKLFNNPLKQLYSTTFFMFSQDLNYVYHNFVIFLLMMAGSIFFLITIFKNLRLKTLPKIMVIESFYCIFYAMLILFYNHDGFRMLISGVPIIFYLIYRNCDWEKLKKILIPLIIFVSFLQILVIDLIIFDQKKVALQTQLLEKIMDEYGQNDIGIDVDFIDDVYRLPMMHMIKNDKHVMMFHFPNQACDKLTKYFANNFKFNLLVFREKTASNCDFIKKNYKIENRNDLALNKDIKVYLHNNYQKNNQ